VPAPASSSLRAGFDDIAGAMAWLDGVGATGLDGHDLTELGLKDGNLIVETDATASAGPSITSVPA
jgi:hypothetical protein